MEQQFITKKFYENYLDNYSDVNHVLQLAEKAISEAHNQSFDMATLHFAQGELYYQLKDYETAIFKWEKVHNSLKGWALKNIADAYMKLERFAEAEEILVSIETSEKTLTMEITMHLFSLYVVMEKFDAAFTVIKQAVELNPDYPKVTETARKFYEEQENWISAVDLAKDEALRTKLPVWLQTLQFYVDEGITKKHSPHYFYDCIFAAYNVSQSFFEEFIISLWTQYENEDDLYIEWLEMMNALFSTIHIDTPTTWDKISNRFATTYQKLTSGDYGMKTIESIMASFFANWLNMSTQPEVLFASTATLAWHEVFPASLSMETVENAKEMFQHVSYQQDVLDYLSTLLKDTLNWSAKKEMPIPEDLKGQSFDTLNHPTLDNREKSGRLLGFLKQILLSIWDEYKRQEQEITDTIEWKEDILAKLNGFIANLQELETEKTKAVVYAYHEMKEKLRTDLEENIPVILKNCREVITEESDFSRIHVELNDEMNLRIRQYVSERITQDFATEAHSWVMKSSSEFSQVQAYLDDMCHSFNILYQIDKLQLRLDYQMLDDWHRDINRITNRVKLDELNILMRFTPQQALLKGAGKVISPIVKNKSMLYTRYKKFIKTKSYEETVEQILQSTFAPFEIFENALDRDVSMFFENIFSTLNKLIEENSQDVTANKALLHNLLASPELYSDPLTLFDLRLRQYELINE